MCQYLWHRCRPEHILSPLNAEKLIHWHFLANVSRWWKRKAAWHWTLTGRAVCPIGLSNHLYSGADFQWSQQNNFCTRRGYNLPYCHPVRLSIGQRGQQPGQMLHHALGFYDWAKNSTHTPPFSDCAVFTSQMMHKCNKTTDKCRLIWEFSEGRLLWRWDELTQPGQGSEQHISYICVLKISVIKPSVQKRIKYELKK